MEPRFEDYPEGSVSEHLWTQVSLYQVVHKCHWDLDNFVRPLWWDHGSYISDTLSCAELNLISKLFVTLQTVLQIRIRIWDPDLVPF
jgi:hypothetical protein